MASGVLLSVTLRSCVFSSGGTDVLLLLDIEFPWKCIRDGGSSIDKHKLDRRFEYLSRTKRVPFESCAL